MGALLVVRAPVGALLTGARVASAISDCVRPRPNSRVITAAAMIYGGAGAPRGGQTTGRPTVRRALSRGNDAPHVTSEATERGERLVSRHTHDWPSIPRRSDGARTRTISLHGGLLGDDRRAQPLDLIHVTQARMTFPCARHKQASRWTRLRHGTESSRSVDLARSAEPLLPSSASTGIM